MLTRRCVVSAIAMVLVGLYAVSFAAERVDTLHCSASVSGNVSSGRMAPYMIGSWQSGRTAMQSDAIAAFSAEKAMHMTRRFDWSAGVSLVGGWHHDVVFDRYETSDAAWRQSAFRPAPVYIEQAYAGVKYRGVFAMGGMKVHESKIVDSRLSSGDLVLSTNARPIPGVTVGFVDFQDIPFTNGCLQIDGRIMYGHFTDDRFRESQFAFYNGVVATHLYYTYKYCYFRTKPSERFSVVFGMQTAGQFGGDTRYYKKGHLVSREHRGFRMVDIFKMFLPTPNNGNEYYEGNSLGSWSLRARYTLGGSGEIAAYWEKPFEDGSGIGCRNGFDGLYGLQYTRGGRGWFESAVVEYLDLRNQSGPLHFAPGDILGSSISSEATGGDNYYNNDTYGAYANYGMAIGSPMVVSPIYNADGYPDFIYNRMRGLHAAASGSVSQSLSYRIMLSWQKGYAMGRIPLPKAKNDFSAMAEVTWRADALLRGVSLSCRAACDRGDLRGDNFGLQFTLAYCGWLTYKR